MNRVATRTRTRAAKVATVGSLRFEQRGPGARRASQAKCRAIAKRPGKVEPVEGTSPATRAPGDELGHQEKISEQALRNLEVRRTKRERERESFVDDDGTTPQVEVLSEGEGVKALGRFNDALEGLAGRKDWDRALEPVWAEMAYNLESFNPVFTACMLKVQCTIGSSE